MHIFLKSTPCKMSTGLDVNFEELACSTDEFNGTQLKAVCVETGMIALCEGATSASVLAYFR